MPSTPPHALGPAGWPSPRPQLPQPPGLLSPSRASKTCGPPSHLDTLHWLFTGTEEPIRFLHTNQLTCQGALLQPARPSPRPPPPAPLPGGWAGTRAHNRHLLLAQSLWTPLSPKASLESKTCSLLGQRSCPLTGDPAASTWPLPSAHWVLPQPALNPSMSADSTNSCGLVSRVPPRVW